MHRPASLQKREKVHKDALVLVACMRIAIAWGHRSEGLPGLLPATELLYQPYPERQFHGRTNLEGKVRVLEVDPGCLDVQPRASWMVGGSSWNAYAVRADAS